MGEPQKGKKSQENDDETEKNEARLRIEIEEKCTTGEGFHGRKEVDKVGKALDEFFNLFETMSVKLDMMD